MKNIDFQEPSGRVQLNNYRKVLMKYQNIYRSTFSIILSIGMLFIVFAFSKWNINKDSFDNSGIENKMSLQQNLVDEDKQKGVHFFGRVDSINLSHLAQNNIEWLTLVAWSDQQNCKSPMVRHHNGDSLMILQRDSSWFSRIKKAQAAGFKVFIKPHVWIYEPETGKWRSDIFPTNEKNWKTWKQSYRDFILRYAKIAEKANAEMFCIGTEFTKLSTEKPTFWKQLIKDVRAIYSGKITYAANWYDEYEKITFWDELDYIGVQAYFPLVKNKNPSVQQVSKGWKGHLSDLKSIHEKFNRKILFTEIGYKSTADSAIEPWKWLEYAKVEQPPISLETQKKCYQAFFNTVWGKEWFAGVHIWQLNDYEGYGGKDNLDFTPQGKPAEGITRKGFE